jgi:hypothetical protein
MYTGWLIGEKEAAIHAKAGVALVRMEGPRRKAGG